MSRPVSKIGVALIITFAAFAVSGCEVVLSTPATAPAAGNGAASTM